MLLIIFCSIFQYKYVKRCTLSIKICFLSIFFLVDKIKLSTFDLLKGEKKVKTTSKTPNCDVKN